MMNQQAHQYFAPNPSCPPLRWYGQNTPRAQGRLVAVAMLADGQLSPPELREISAETMVASTGLDRGQFLQVLFELCEDIESRLKPNGRALLDDDVVDQLLTEVSNPIIQHSTLQAIRAATVCDGSVDPDESRYLHRAIETWKAKGYRGTTTGVARYVCFQPWEG